MPLLPLKRIYPSRACPLLSESKSGREYPYLAGKGAYPYRVTTFGTVIGQGLIGRADQEIWTRCQLGDRLLIAQDLDFSDSRKLQPGNHVGIVLVRFRNPGRVALFSVIDLKPASSYRIKTSHFYG